LPDWRGPVTATTGIRLAASRRPGSRARGIMHGLQIRFTIYAIVPRCPQRTRIPLCHTRPLRYEHLARPTNPPHPTSVHRADDSFPFSATKLGHFLAFDPLTRLSGIETPGGPEPPTRDGPQAEAPRRRVLEARSEAGADLRIDLSPDLSSTTVSQSWLTGCRSPRRWGNRGGWPPGCER